MAWREAIKKPVAKPTAPKPKFQSNDDDWETDINYQNVSSEKSQRYGSSSVPGTGRIDHVDFKSIQDKVKTADHTVREVYQEKNPNRGYGGKYGTDQVMDKSAADFSYQADVPKHSSQTDFKKGFGGTFGVDERAKDKSAMGFDYQAPVEKHSSQTDFSKGFGGKFGTDSHAQDKSAVDFSHRETLAQHSSQKDYSHGFGGKYGIQKEESSRLTKPSPPPSEHRVMEKPLPPVGSSAGVGNIRARFENMKREQEDDAARRVAEERQKRTSHEQQTKPNPPAPSTVKTPVAEPSPPPAPVFAEPRPAPEPTVYENLSVHHAAEESPSGESTRFTGETGVSSILRQRKTSSSSSKHEEEEEDEWAVEHHAPAPQRSPSPVVQAAPAPPVNEGIRCIARYSYQKTEEDELGFEENEIITHVQKMHDEWWSGRIGARSGLFPANYVEEI